MKSNQHEVGRKVSYDYVVIPPDGGWGWVVVFAAFYCNMVIDGVQLCFGMILPEMATYYETDLANISLIGSIMFGVHLLVGPLCAALCHRFGERATAIFGSFLTAAGIAVGYFRPPYPVFYLTFGVIGGTGLCFVNMTSIVVTSLYFSKRRVIAVGCVVCGTGAGTMVFAYGANLILKHLSWSEVLICEAVVTLSMAIAVLAYRPLKPQRIPRTLTRMSHTLRHSTQQIYYASNENLAHGNSPSINSVIEMTGDVLEEFATHVAFTQIEELPQPNLPRPNLFFWLCCCCKKYTTTTRRKCSCKQILSNMKQTMSTMLDFRILKSCAFTTFCIAGALSSTGLVVVFFYEKARILDHGYSDDKATYFVILLGASTMIWRLVLGVVAIIPQVNFYALNIIGLCLGGVAVAFSSVIQEHFFFYIWGLLYGLATGCFSVFFPVMLLELVGLEKISNATGITMMFMGIFSIIGPPFAGWLKILTGGFDAIFALAGGMFFSSGLLYTFITGHTSPHSHDRMRGVVLH